MRPLDENLWIDDYEKIVNTPTKKSKNKKRVLSDEQIIEIYKLKNTKSLGDIAKMFKRADGKPITKSMISDIWNNKLYV